MNKSESACWVGSGILILGSKRAYRIGPITLTHSLAGRPISSSPIFSDKRPLPRKAIRKTGKAARALIENLFFSAAFNQTDSELQRQPHLLLNMHSIKTILWHVRVGSSAEKWLLTERGTLIKSLSHHMCAAAGAGTDQIEDRVMNS
ncbi:hypothetical protein ACFX1Q_037138 [Malus domestica]